MIGGEGKAEAFLGSLLKGSYVGHSVSVHLFLFLLLPALLSAQTLPPKMTAFSKEQYGGQGQIHSVQTLPDGRIAIGVDDRVFIYDGEGFRGIEVGKGKSVYSMEVDRKGRLFVGGNAHFGLIRPDSSGRWVYRSLHPLLPDSLHGHGVVWGIHCGPDGGVYFNAQQQNLFYYKNDTIQRIPPENKYYKLHTPGQEAIIQDVRKGFHSLNGMEQKSLEGTKKMSGMTIRAVLPAVDDGGETWIFFSHHQGLFRYDPEKGEKKPFPENEEGRASLKALRKGRVYCAIPLDPEQNPYEAAYAVGTLQNGIHFLDENGRSLLHIDKGDGLPANMIWQLSSDDRGNIWAATNNGFVLLHTGIPFTRIPSEMDPDASINAVARGCDPTEPKSDAPLFLATSQGVWRWKEEEKGFGFIRGSDGKSFDLLHYPGKYWRKGGAKEDRMMVASPKKVYGIPVYPEASFPMDSVEILYRRPSHVFQHLPGSLIGEEADHFLSGGRKGLFIYGPPDPVDDTTLHRRGWIRGNPENFRTLAWDSSGTNKDSLRIWAGFKTAGVWKVMVDNSKLKRDTFHTGFYRTVRYDTSDGLPEGTIRVYQGLEGKGPIFSTQKGFFEFEDGDFVPAENIGPFLRDLDRAVDPFVEGPDGALWWNDERGGGIKHLKDGWQGKTVDSLPFRAIDVGAVRSIHPEKDRTWIAGEDGLVSYYPQRKQELQGDWSCRIREVRGVEDSLLFTGTFSKELKRNEGIDELEGRDFQPIEEQPERMKPVLSASMDRLLFKFAALFPDRPEKTRYRFKLEGFDTAWSAPTHTNKKEYTNLPEGAYTFKVKAENLYGHESKSATYRFRILPPWYRTWWAYTSYGVGGVGFIALLVWLNGRRLMAQKRRLERIVEERTQEIRAQKEKVEEQKEEVERQKGIVEEAHQEITQSIDYAQKIQFALLQSEEQVSPNLPSHFILFKPQSQVSGDFYWAKEKNGFVYIAAVDCTGHGVPGAFMSMLGISQLNEVMNKDRDPSPGEILTELRDRVVRELSGGEGEETAKDGMDAAILKIPNPKSQGPNPKEGLEVEFSGAQNPMYVVREGIADDHSHLRNDRDRSVQNPIKPFKKSSDGIEIKGDPMPVGYDEYAKESFTTVRLQLQKGDMCYIFSDGYADQFGGPKGKKFRYGPFKELLVDIHQKDVEEQKEVLEQQFEEWKAESDQVQIDDVVVIGIRL